MEPASFALAIVGIYQTCVAGYAIVSDAYHAPADAQDAARRIRIEEAVLHGWGEHFGVEKVKAADNEKLKSFIGTGKTFDGVFDALNAIAEVFTDVHRMERRYGLLFEWERERGEVSPRMPFPAPRLYLSHEIDCHIMMLTHILET